MVEPSKNSAQPGRLARADAPRRWLLRALPLLGLTAIAAAGIPGCPRSCFREDERLQLTATSAARGTTVTFDATFLASESDLGSVAFDVAGSPDAALIGRAPPPEGIVVTVEPTTPQSRTGRRYRFDIAADAPLRPVYVRADYVTEQSSYGEYHYFIRPFDIHLGAGAPSVSAPIPAFGVRGTSVDVEIPATAIVGTVAIATRDPWITATNTTYDSGVGRVRTTLVIAPDARTGETALDVVNGDGVRSIPLTFTVTAGQPAPALTGLFPNFVYVGTRLPAVLAAGSGFTAGTAFDPSDPDKFTPGASTLLDSRACLFPVDVAAQVAAGSVSVAVETVGGRSNSATLRIVDEDTVGPTLARVVPDEVATNTTALVRIEGAHLDLAGPLEIVAIASDAVVLPFLRAEVVPGSAPHAGFVVARLVGMPGDPSVPGTPTGTVRLAVRNADGFATAAAALRIAPRPEAPYPLVLSASVGRIERGGEVVETITGENLRDVERVYVESGGVELKRGLHIGDEPTGRTLTFTLAATDAAPLTGDAATNLVVVTRGGRRSNRLAYEVAVSSGGGGGCGAPVTSGVHLVATGASGFRAEIETADSAIDRTTQVGDVFIDHCSPAFDCFGMFLHTGRNDLHVGSYSIESLRFSDRFGSTWVTTAPTSVQVVAASPSYVVFCIDHVLPGTGVNEDIRLTGQVVLAR